MNGLVVLQSHISGNISLDDDPVHRAASETLARREAEAHDLQASPWGRVAPGRLPA